MAGVGNRLDTKIYPRESFGHMQPFSIEDYSSTPAQLTGGGGISKLKRQDIDEIRTRTQERLTLDDVRWSDMRKKVPLMGRVPTSRMEEMNDDQLFEKQKREHVSFIRQNFKQVECQRFIPAEVQNPRADTVAALKCHCGEVLRNHVPFELTANGKRNFGNLIPQELKPYIHVDVNSLNKKPDENMPKVVWKKEDALKERPTSSFGKVKFTGMEQVGGMKPAKYLRLKDEKLPDSADLVIKLLKEHWKIMQPKTPSLIISVVGGAKNFKLSGKMRETFQTGLIKASQTTNAWLITSGFNMGVMKEVGLAVREGQSFEWFQDRFAHVLRCIGIAPWGYVKNRHVLTDHSVVQPQGKFDKMAEYKTSNVIEHLKPVPLNSDHTHFIFVDDGHRNLFQGVNDFRARFEKRLSDPVNEGGEGIPVVLIVVEGGRDAIDAAKTSLEQNIPVILCEGTGRAADILVYAYNNPERGNKIKKMIKKFYFEPKPHEKDDPAAIAKSNTNTDKVFEVVKSCIKQKHLISIFHINKHEELDNEILKILLKAKTGEATEQQRLERLKLALKWDRADIAQEEIFREDALWSRGSFDECLKDAILSDNVQFVQIILNQGVVMRDYLTLNRLMELYREAIDNGDLNSLPLRKVMENCKIRDMTRDNLVKIMVKLMDKFDLDITDEAGEDDEDADNDSLCLIDPNDNRERKFKYPYKQLMVWSVLLLRKKMAHFAIKMGREPITSTVAASRIYYSLTKYIHSNESSLKNKVALFKVEFDDLGTEVLDECHQRDPNKAMMLAERKSPIWSNMTSMQIAASADNQTFLASVGCQNSISTIWKRGITSGKELVFMIALFPFLAVTPLLEVGKLGDRQLTGFQKFMTFLTSPIAKFSYHSLMYVIFLVLFTYFVLVEFRIDHVTTIEIICVVWILTFIIDEIYTCLAFPSPTLKGTIRDYFGILKIMNLLNCILTLVAFFLHYDGTHYKHAKAIFCINNVVYCIRILDIYIVNSRLGPKMVMIKRMMLELVTFILVLTVFLVSYGIVSQGLLYLQRRSDWVILKDIIYFPYWQFYGELFLDEIDDDTQCMDNAIGMAVNGTIPATYYCRTFHWLVPIFLAAYLLIGNVLLLNLLIAIFSNVFHEVEVNSNRIWNYQMYMLVMEFDTKAALVAPFSFLIHIYLIFKWIFRKTCCKKAKDGRQFGSRHLEYLQLFEKEQLSNYLRKKKAKAKSSTDISILAMQKRIDELYKMIKEDFLDEADAPSVERADTLIRSKTMDSTFPAAGSAKDTAVSDKEELERKEKKRRKKKKKKKEKEDEEKLLNIDKDIQKPEVEKMDPDLLVERHSVERSAFPLPGLPPSGTPKVRRRRSLKSKHKEWSLDSDSDDDKPFKPVRMNIPRDSENSDLNDFSNVRKKRDRSKHQDSISEEDIQYRGSRIRQKLRKKRSHRSDSDS